MLGNNGHLFAVVASFTRRIKFVERFIKRNGLLCGEKQFPAKQGIKYLSLRAAVQFSERRYARHTRRRLLAGKIYRDLDTAFRVHNAFAVCWPRLFLTLGIEARRKAAAR